MTPALRSGAGRRGVYGSRHYPFTRYMRCNPQSERAKIIHLPVMRGT